MAKYGVATDKAGEFSLNRKARGRFHDVWIEASTPTSGYGHLVPIADVVPVPKAVEERMLAMVRQTGWPTFVAFVLAAPLLEELIFRGIMLDGLLKRYRPLTAILVSSLLFGLVHGNPWQFVTGFVIGCFLGWVYYRTGSVAACVVIHMSANFSGYLGRLLTDVDAPAEEQLGIIDAYGGGSAARFAAVHATLLMVFIMSLLFLRREFDKEDLSRRAISAA